MNTTQTLLKTEMWQPEPQRNLVERTPVEEGTKLPIANGELKLIQEYSWEDLRGLSLGFDEEWF
ncbi:MAG: hypothetical protein OEM89_00840 [Nitrosopumilus sp.]|nr:hypothetical protein [Nitrosopumilus sp.]